MGPEERERAWLRRQDHGSHALFILQGMPYKFNDLDNLRQQIDQTLLQPGTSMVFEFRECGFLDSAFINLLIKTLQACRRQERPMALVTRDRDIVEALALCNLD